MKSEQSSATVSSTRKRVGAEATGAPPTESTSGLDAMIREEAYALAERRGFRPGNEIQDWLEAEKTVCSRLGIKHSGSAKPTEH